jgi:hypothetical protein
MNKDKKQNYKNKQYLFFLTIGLIGIINFASKSFLPNLESGLLTYIVGVPFSVLFGTSFGAFITIIFKIFFDLALLWLIIAWLIKPKENILGSTDLDKI